MKFPQITLTILAFTYILTAFAQLPAYLPTNGLVAWYPFNGNANDESGNGNNGLVNGASLTADRFNQNASAYDFNGIDNFIEVTHSPELQFFSNLTISCWVKIEDYSTNPTWGTRTILSKPRGYLGSGLFLYSVNETVGVYGGGVFNSWPDGYSVNSSEQLPLNDWENVILTYDGSFLRLYKNGEFINSTYSTIELDPATTPLYIGREFLSDPPNYSRWFKGSVDDIVLYNRALTESEVTALYTATATNTGGGTTSSTTAPPGIPYQAEVRNDNGEVLANAIVNVRFTLHELTANGTIGYQETHALTTNELGLFAATIGAGTATQGTFAGINWSQTTKFLQVEVDAGNGYITMGNQQLMSVPYALYAANGPEGPQGPVGPQGPAGEQGQSGINGLTSLINVSNTLPDSNCPQGGIKIENGLDYNINNILDSTEINSIQTKTICFQNETNSNLNNLIFGSRNISSNSELNNAVTIVSESGNGIWCCGPTHTVPAGKLWKIAGYSGVVSSGLLTGETWLDEGQSITFQGNSNNGGSIPYSFTAFEYTKSELDFSVVSNYGTGIWCCGPSFTVPSGKIWKVIGYSGAVNSGIMNGETWLDEGQSLTFQGNSNNGGGIPFRFIAFEYSK